MTKTLRVELADLEGIPHSSAPANTTVTVSARYTGPVILTDGTIIPAVPKSESMGSNGRVDFTVHTSDSPDVSEDHHGFAVRVDAKVTEPSGRSYTYTRTVKPLEYMADIVRLGRMPSAEGLPARWVSIEELTDEMDAAVAAANQAATDASNALAQVGPAATAAAAPAVSAAQAAQTSAASSASDAADAVTLAQQAQAAALEVPDANVSALIGNPTTDTRTALDGTYATRRLGLAPGKVAPKTLPYDAQNPVVVDAFDGALWGFQGNAIRKSTDNGETWTAHCPAPVGDVVLRLIPCNDGEVISARVGGIYKSSGWQSGSVTWTQKVTVNGAARIQQFQVDGDGTKFIAAQYGPGASGSQAWIDSRYAHISVDGGDTWTQAFDSEALNPGQNSHVHGACYDPWSDRFYLSEGHDTGGGVYYSTDDGATWTRPDALHAQPAPTVLVPTDDGIVCASDHADAGLWGIVRQENPDDEVFTRTWVWTSPGADAVIGFGMRGHRDPDTGVVYVGFTAGQTTVAPVIAGGTASVGAEVWRMPEPATYAVGDSIHQVVVNEGVLHAARTISGSTHSTLRATLPAPGAVPVVDAGNTLGGKAMGSSVAVGPGATIAATANNSVAIGTGAQVTGTGGSMIAVGPNSQVTHAGGTAIGRNATAAGSSFAMGFNSAAGGESVCIGDSSTSNGLTRGVAIGRNASVRTQSVAIGFNAVAATTTGTWAVAIGDSASTAHQGVAIGRQATVGATSGTALGFQANAPFARSVALGQGSTTTVVDSVAIGARHIEAGILPGAPGSPGADTYRLFATKNGSGKVELRVRFPSGSTTTLATEA